VPQCPTHVDHIVIGARQNSLVRSLLGSVASRVAAEVPCTVTVARPPRVASPSELEETSEKPDDARD
jgi:eukaryotic-like serine/threonine-protein kinase